MDISKLRLRTERFSGAACPCPLEQFGIYLFLDNSLARYGQDAKIAKGTPIVWRSEESHTYLVRTPIVIHPFSASFAPLRELFISSDHLSPHARYLYLLG